MKALQLIKEKISFTFHVSFFNIFVGLILLASFFLATKLPTEMGWENGLIEDMQIVVLAMGALIAVSFCPRRIKHDGNAISGIFALMICRELSWGRVFLTPTRITEMGPVFPKIKNFAWWPLLYVAIGVIIIVICHGFVHDFHLINFLQIKIPVWSFALIILATVLHQVGEGCYLPFLTHPQSQIVEELAELALYLELVNLTIYYGFAETFLSARLSTKKIWHEGRESKLA